MRGGALPPALLGAALGLGLAFGPQRARIPALLAYAVMAAAAWLAPTVPGWREAVFLGCWVSIIATAASIHLPPGVGAIGAVVLALNAGAWSGEAVAAAGAPFDLLKALPCAPAAMLAAGLVRDRSPIAVKVVASWLIAVAALAALLPFLPVTPGYAPDHLD